MALWSESDIFTFPSFNENVTDAIGYYSLLYIDKAVECPYDDRVIAFADTLKEMGADIVYSISEDQKILLNIRSFSQDRTPLNIRISDHIGWEGLASVLLIIPSLKREIACEVSEQVVEDYRLQALLESLRDFGIDAKTEPGLIKMPVSKWVGKNVVVPIDPDVFSFWIIKAIMNPGTTYTFHRSALSFFEKSRDPLRKTGIKIEPVGQGVSIYYDNGTMVPDMIEYHFEEDFYLFLPLVIYCGVKGIRGIFSGVDGRLGDKVYFREIKAVLQNLGISLMEMPSRFSHKSKKKYFMVEGVYAPDDMVDLNKIRNEHALQLIPLVKSSDRIPLLRDIYPIALAGFMI